MLVSRGFGYTAAVFTTDSAHHVYTLDIDRIEARCQRIEVLHLWVGHLIRSLSAYLRSDPVGEHVVAMAMAQDVMLSAERGEKMTGRGARFCLAHARIA